MVRIYQHEPLLSMNEPFPLEITGASFISISLLPTVSASSENSTSLVKSFNESKSTSRTIPVWYKYRWYHGSFMGGLAEINELISPLPTGRMTGLQNIVACKFLLAALNHVLATFHDQVPGKPIRTC
jgi:hypothetical protein